MKRGKFALTEEQYIRDSVYEKTPQEIANVLNRDYKTIEKYMKRNDMVPFTREETEREKAGLKNKLFKKSYYLQVKAQITGEELEYFVASWINFMQQFNEDILYSEEMEMKEWIILEILKNRSMKDRMKHIEEAEKLEKLRDALLDDDRKTGDDKHADVIHGLTDQILSIRNSETAYTAEHVKFLEKSSNIAKNLKAIRSERIKRIEDGKSTFSGYIKMLENEKERRQVGAEMEIMRHAKDVAKAELGKLHTYVDDTVDRPFLTPEIVLEND